MTVMMMMMMMTTFCSNSDPNQVMFGGEIFGESAVEFEQQIGLEVVHTFEVTVTHVVLCSCTDGFDKIQQMSNERNT